MKKIFLSTALAVSGLVLFAQDTTSRTNNSMGNTSNSNTTTNQQMNSSTNLNSNTYNTSDQMYNTNASYNAYGIPNYVQMNFQTRYPNVTNLTWMAPTADWYHAYFPLDSRYTHVYYSTDPYYDVAYYPERVTGYTLSLPVLQTWVPDDVISTATNLYKQNLYDITALKGSNKQDIYQVRVMDNGELKTIWMDANGTAVTDYWRTEDQMNMNNTTDMNSATSTDTNAAMNGNSTDNTNVKTKTKTKMSDGSEIKTKTKNGKTKTKVSGNGNSSSSDQY